MLRSWRGLLGLSKNQNLSPNRTVLDREVRESEEGTRTWAGRRWDVFISYDWDSGSDLAITLQESLKKAGLRVFVDRTNSESGNKLSEWL